jgi:hypothetical protein
MAITKAVWKFTFRKHSLRMAALCSVVSARRLLLQWIGAIPERSA